MRGKPRKWWVSGLLSLFCPGLGQIYNGQPLKGIFFLILSISIPFFSIQALSFYSSSLPLLGLVIMTIISTVIYLTVITDAIINSCRLRHDYQLRKYNRLALYIAIILLEIIMPIYIPGLNISIEQIKNNYIEAFKIPSKSMEPTLLSGDCILVDRCLSSRVPGRGDIVVFKYPKDERKYFIMRVVAIGGDSVEIRDKQLYINNKPIEDIKVAHKEPDVIPADFSPRDNFGPVTTPADSFFVMGDNRDRAFDSRFWGFLDKSSIAGTARQIYWSWDQKASNVRWERIGKRIF